MKNTINLIEGGMDAAVINTKRSLQSKLHGLKSSWMMILIQIAFVALIGFSFASCDIDKNNNNKNNNNNGEGEVKTLPAGTYNGAPAGDLVRQGTGDVTVPQGRLDQITAPTFTIDSDGLVTALAFGSGGSAFLTVSGGGGAAYRFVVVGTSLDFQIKQYGSSSFASYNTTASGGEVINGVSFLKSVSGSFNESAGTVNLALDYARMDNTGVVSRAYDFTKQ